MLTISLFQFRKRFKPAEFQNKVHQVGVSLRVKIYKLNHLMISMEVVFCILEIHCVKSVQIQSFFWSVLSCIRIEYGDLLCKSPHSVRIQKNTDQKKLRIWTLFTLWYYLCIKKTFRWKKLKTTVHLLKWNRRANFKIFVCPR